MRRVMQEVVERSGWADRGALPDDTGMGIAFHYSHRGYFAEVVQAKVSRAGELGVEKVWVVGDIGRQIINPMNAVNNAQGGVIDGLSQAIGQVITMEGGAARQGHFNRYPLLRLPDAPEVDIRFVVTDNDPTGLGEPPLPPVIPALCNAIFAVTGTRVRALPIEGWDLSWG